ncbi:MAG TPA: bifunctional acetate--CoA ligase family protein/GNAT family N-acetyltransferase [Verrucomicrobiae bacterium]|nr:bifunctional acetate--CoA ligase family protein/GNAT family N-acetyltransferase [Verrucomicrobiae bacterium]
MRQVRGNPLDAIFLPKTVAVISATEEPGSVGSALLKNLGAFEGAVYPVNPKRASVLGIQAFPNIAAVPEKVDLAVIATPAATVPNVIRECVQAGVPGAIIISAGFKECGTSGAELEHQVLGEAKHGPIRVIGPNCLGIMTPHTGLNATFAASLARPGNVAFISQSGALCTATLDWSLRENVGFSAFVSVGSMLDVGWGDLIYYLGDDPRTRSIVIYMESVGDARSFLSAAREVAFTKPIIVIKVGHTEAAAKAAASHTGSLTGSDEVLDAAFRRAGVLRVNAIEELFDMAEVLGKQPRPRGPRLAIVTNAGGPGALATDALVNSGGQLAELSEGTRAALDILLPPHWSHGNPIDILGDAGPERYAKAVKLSAEEPNSDGVLVILTPQAMTDAAATAEQLKPLAKLDGKPILASWMGGPAVDAGEAILNTASIPTFKYPDRAARAFDLMWRYSCNLRALYETPALLGQSDQLAAGRVEAEKIIQTARKASRTILTEFESKQILAAYGIPTVETRIAFTEDDAVARAHKIGFPVVVKLFSETLTHKTDVGGVHLDVRNATAVRHAWRSIEASVREKAGHQHFLGVTVQPMVLLDGYELILGSSIDSQFGPVLLFGAGGQLVEVFKDRALGLPPLNATLARRLMEQTRIYTALQGVRGRQPVDLAALENLLVRFSQLVAEQRWIKEIDINPLLVSSERMLALDARMVLHGSDVSEEKLPKLAIRPYPTRYVTRWKLKNGAPVLIRPIRPEDEPLMVKFHQTLSERSVYLRYFTPLKLDQRVAHERLSRICFIDYDREMVLVVERRDAKNGQPEILGVGRLSKLHGPNEAEFALTIGDQCQNHGLGTQLLRMLVQVGRDEKLERITATILPDNREMQHVARKVGFEVSHETGAGEVLAQLRL